MSYNKLLQAIVIAAMKIDVGRFALIGILILLHSMAWAQESCKGTIVESVNHDGLSYVNIGVVGKSIGTVSDMKGNFYLEIPDGHEQDTIRISSLGYAKLDMQVVEFKDRVKRDGGFALNEVTTVLNEVKVTERKLKQKILGNTTESRAMSAGFNTDVLGNEVGVLMKIKKSPTYIKEFNFCIATNTYEEIKFRVNLYKKQDGLPGELMQSENIIVETDISEGVVRVDLQKYNLVAEDDFFVTLEYIEDMGVDGLLFSASVLGAPLFARDTSHDSWNKINVATLGFNVLVSY